MQDVDGDVAGVSNRRKRRVGRSIYICVVNNYKTLSWGVLQLFEREQLNRGSFLTQPHLFLTLPFPLFSF